MTLNNSMSITPSPLGQAKGVRFEHGSVLGGKTRAAWVSSQWKSTLFIKSQFSGLHRASSHRSSDHRALSRAGFREWDAIHRREAARPRRRFYNLTTYGASFPIGPDATCRNTKKSCQLPSAESAAVVSAFPWSAASL